MIKEKRQAYEIISKGDLVMLRSHLETDWDRYQNVWLKGGEWLQYDAPWAQAETGVNTEQGNNQEGKSAKDNALTRSHAIIATLGNRPLGWVN